MSLTTAGSVGHRPVRQLTPPGRVLAAQRLACELTPRRSHGDPYPQTLHHRATFRMPGPASPRSSDGEGDLGVAWADLVVLPRWDQATFEALDDQTWDLSAFGRLLRRGYYEILADLCGEDPRAAAAGSRAVPPGVVLVDQVCVEPAWRGHRLGLVGVGLALQALRRDAAFAILYPMRPALASDAERAASRRRLTQYWSRLGFTHGYEDHLVLDLTVPDLDAALDRLVDRPEDAPA